jgi:hypothetical protein
MIALEQAMQFIAVCGTKIPFIGGNLFTFSAKCSVSEGCPNKNEYCPL